MSEERKASERDRGGLGDEQGTTVGTPQPGKSGDVQPTQGDAAGDRAARIADSGKGQQSPRSTSGTGAGSEATARPESAPIDQHDTEHRSGYGGAGGDPVTSSDERE